jgi:hypothetical protein
VCGGIAPEWAVGVAGSRKREGKVDGETRFLCIACRVQGEGFLRAAHALGVKTTLLTLDGLGGADWPREALEDLATMPEGMSVEQVLNTVSWMARTQRYDRIVALGTEDLLLVAAIREHMRVAGMGLTTAGYYRDRLAMRIGAREAGFAVGEFARVLHREELRVFMEQTSAPWRLLPRQRDLGWESFRIDTPDELWAVLEQLGDAQSRYLMEQIVEGERFTVASIVNDGSVVFSVALQQGQGTEAAETLATVDRGSRDWLELTAIDAGLAPSLGMVRGIACARFVRRGNRHLFEEIAAGPGDNGIDRVVRAATGIDLWQEWARLELADLRSENYVPGEWFEKAAGAVSWPESSQRQTRLDAVALVERWKRAGRVSGVVRADSAAEVQATLALLVG